MDGFHFYRRLFHLFAGIVIAFLIFYNFLSPFVAAIVVFVGFSLSMIDKHAFHIPVLHFIAEKLDRPGDLKAFPAKGSILFLVGVFFVLFFPRDIAVASVLILSFGDPVAALVGSKFGRIKDPFDENKMLEGSVAGFLVAGVVASFFVPVFNAFFASFIAIFVEALSLRIDDNILVPVVSAFVLWLL